MIATPQTQNHIQLADTNTNVSEQPDYPTHSMSSIPEKSNKKNWLAIAALTIAFITLIIAILIAFVVIPNNQCNCINDTSTSSDALQSNNNGNGNNNDNTPTIIINETDRYYVNNITQFYDWNRTCPTNTMGIINVNITHAPGGYTGWHIDTSYPEFYPLPDIHAYVGDTILFRSPRDSTSEDLWLVPKAVFDSCDFSPGNGGMQLAIRNDIRYDRGNGYYFLIQDWHVRDWGSTLYFTSSYEWNDPTSNRGCPNGMKVKVIIEDRVAIPVITDDAAALDLTASDTVQDLMAAVGHLSRMLILQQFHSENRIRSEGDSGITQTRGNYDGNSDYDDGTYTNGNVLSIHNHANNERVVGIGELSAVLNGVEFKTRHNDYNLNMPSRTSSEYHAVESIPYPDVPPEVLNKATISEQIIEMQEWFRAFKTQNASHRNYSLYFRPILCYLEGTWITDSDSISEPFTSDRHYIDAATWKELHDKVRWMANSGRKDTNENYATLPSSIRNLVNETYPIISNFEYRILCSPISNDIPISRFRVVDDLSVQLMGSPETRRELKYSRRARFELNKNIDSLSWDKGRMKWNYLDYLMEQIPGKNNYLANLTDLLPDGTGATLNINNKDEIINSGYYSRFYSLSDSDAMGSSNHRRGYSDRYLFAAQTTHLKVSPITLFETESRWSYAIPIEIIYLTPLSKWNPYSIPYESDKNLWQERTGKCGENPSQAWIEMKNSIYYLTPSQFFEGNHNEDSADTAIKGACAISPNDNTEYGVEASGHWIVFPSIGNGVGYVRQRYPIFPIHHSGSPAFKEIKAFEQIILPENYDDIENGIPFWTDERDLQYGFNLYLEGGGHDHIIFIKGKWIKSEWLNITSNKYYNGEKYIIEQDSDIGNGHTHTVKLYRERQSENHPWIYQIKQCRFGLKNEDNIGYIYQNNSCADFHDTLRRDTGEETNVKGTNA